MSDDRDEEDPLADLDDAAGEDPFSDLEDLPADEPPGEDAFVEMSTGEVDEEALWAELEGSTDGAPASGEDEEVVVPKRSYCERCEFFDAPPSVRCTNSGTEILELVDAEHFRVVGCPVVERRRASGFQVDPDEED